MTAKERISELTECVKSLHELQKRLKELTPYYRLYFIEGKETSNDVWLEYSDNGSTKMWLFRDNNEDNLIRLHQDQLKQLRDVLNELFPGSPMFEKPVPLKFEVVNDGE